MSNAADDKPPVCLPTVVMPPEVMLPEPTATRATRKADDADNTEVIPTSSAPNAASEATLLHWTFLAIALVIVSASFSLSIHNREQVIVPILDVPLPGSCTFRELTGLPCPGCGLTRSFISMAHGRIGDAWAYNPGGFFFFAVVAFQIPFRIAQIVRIRRGQMPYRMTPFDHWALIVLVVILLLQWFIGLLGRW